MLGDFNSCNVFQISFDLATPGESTLDPHRHNLEFVSDGCSSVSYKLIDGMGLDGLQVRYRVLLPLLN